MELDLQIKGLDTLLADFAQTPRIVQRVFDGRSNQALNEQRRKLQRYPAPRAGQRYVRTNKQRDGWSDTPARRGPMGLALRNPIDHTRWSQDRENQAWMHQGRGWWTVQDAQEEVDASDLADQMAADIARQLGG